MQLQLVFICTVQHYSLLLPLSQHFWRVLLPSNSNLPYFFPHARQRIKSQKVQFLWFTGNKIWVHEIYKSLHSIFFITILLKASTFSELGFYSVYLKYLTFLFSVISQDGYLHRFCSHCWWQMMSEFKWVIAKKKEKRKNPMHLRWSNVLKHKVWAVAHLVDGLCKVFVILLYFEDITVVQKPPVIFFNDFQRASLSGRGAQYCISALISVLKYIRHFLEYLYQFDV